MIIIGEKLNGSIPIVGEAIARRDAAFLTERVRMQAEAGADFIDVCVSVDVAIEVETFEWVIGLVQAATDLPICLDSPNPDALLAAMAFCNQPGLINSVSLEGDKLDRIFPAIAGTDWQCVALLCDDSGIPDTVERRLSVLDNILCRAKAFGIAPNRLYIDPLVTALATDPNAQLVFSECAQGIRARCPEAHITSGLSNISFGLPERRAINQAFLALAMQVGMDSAILDPTDRSMRTMIHAVEALLGHDESALRYIGFVSARSADMNAINAPPESEQACASASTLAVAAVFSAVEQGAVKQIEALTEQALAVGAHADAILNEGMIAAMTVIGERFSRGEIFMPEMLIAARAMKKGVAALKPHLASGASGAYGKVILGTVAGDLHDIGKNLVGVMMESAGFELVDLGVDVPPDAFVSAVQTNPDACIVGLSSLLTTSMPAMRETVQALDALENRSNFSVMVGGAPVTEAFANEIGADAYTADAAAAAVRARMLAARTGKLK